MAILGIDEVGRGPLAGPLVVGAVVLPDEKPDWVAELKDSKKLSAKKREMLSEKIWAEAPGVGLGFVSAAELDAVGISEALRLATRRAVKSVQRLHASFSQIVIDGKVNFLNLTPLAKYVTTVVKADDLIKEVSAASIVAKVARDNYMKEMGERFPGYGFEKHVGYGTAAHIAAIREKGICEEHRQSFEPIRTMVGFKKGGDARSGVDSCSKNVVKNTTFVGAMGEDAVASYLASAGHTIIERNFKTYYYEIDIVSVKDDEIYFTEVKYRKNDKRGGGLAAIDKRKQKQMRYAAECFMKFREREFGNLNPLLAVADVAGEDFEVRDWFSLGE